MADTNNQKLSYDENTKTWTKNGKPYTGKIVTMAGTSSERTQEVKNGKVVPSTKIKVSQDVTKTTKSSSSGDNSKSPKSNNTSTPSPTTGATISSGGSSTATQAGSSTAALAASLGIVPGDFTTTSTTSTKKPAKSGVYTSTQVSTRIPNDDAIIDNINTVFDKYYGRKANESEISNLLPKLKAQYKSKDGQDKTTVKSTYKNGQLIKTEYLTANGEDPKIWLENNIQETISKGKLGVNALNIPEGPAGKYFVALKNLAARNGLQLSDSAATDYATGIVSGKLAEDTVFNTLRESAANAFPALGEKIKQGIDLKTLADPYIQSMSNILEIPDTGIDLFDPKIRSALAYTMPDGSVGTKSIYDFEKELRQDPRWQYTNNAREAVSSAALKVLKDFGFQG